MTREDSESIAMVEWFARQYPQFAPLLLHAANEGGVRGTDGSHFAKLAKRKKMGVRPGVADYFLALPRLGYHGLWLELKAPEGRIKPEQRVFLDAMAKQGYAACCAWGWQDAKTALLDYILNHWAVHIPVAYQGGCVRRLDQATDAGKAKRGGNAK
jgi:hypothetical protein